MKSSAGVLVVGVIGLGLAAPTLAAGGHAAAPRFVSTQVRPQNFAKQERRGFGGLGASGVYSTLLSGTFPSAPEAGIVVPPPYPPYYLVPAVAPPPPCVRPLLIHLVLPRHVAKLPRVVYGTPFTCQG